MIKVVGIIAAIMLGFFAPLGTIEAQARRSGPVVSQETEKFGMGAGRPRYSVLCYAGNGLPYAPSDEQDACVQACVVAADPESWRAYQHYCIEVGNKTYSRDACIEAINRLGVNDEECRRTCCPRIRSLDSFVEKKPSAPAEPQS